jgi:hypothetical protein
MKQLRALWLLAAWLATGCKIGQIQPVSSQPVSIHELAD